MFAVISQPHFKLLTSFTLFTLLRKEALVQTKTQVFSYVEERKKLSLIHICNQPLFLGEEEGDDASNS